MALFYFIKASVKYRGAIVVRLPVLNIVQIILFAFVISESILIVLKIEYRLSRCYITKTCLFKYTENFTTKTNENFPDKKVLTFFIFLLKA